MRMLRIFILVLLPLVFIQCQKELSYVGGPDPIPVVPNPVTATIQGNILDENGMPAEGVNIKVGSKQAVTDEKGYFRIIDASLDKNSSLVTAEKQGYFKGYRTFPATSGVNHVEIKLIKRDLTGSIDAAAGGTVNLNNGSTVTLPAGGVVVESTGAAYTGTVNVYAAYIDPTAQDIGQVVPGSFIADDENGGRVVMASFGMMAVELESASGEKLQIKTGSKAKISSPIPSSLQSTAPATIDMWYVDENTGIWKEEGSGQKNGNTYEAEVSHFSFWNWDVSFIGVNISMTLKNDAGNPLIHAWVKIISTSSAITVTGNGYTDSAGQVGGLVPMNEVLEMQVLDKCNNVVYSQNIGPFSSATNLGEITIPNSVTAVQTIEGTVLDCFNNPVTDGYVMLYYDNNIRYAGINANGEFSLSFVRCPTGSNIFQMLAVDANGQQQGAIMNFDFTGQVTSVGNLLACGTNTTQFINFTLDGTVYSFISSQDSLTGKTFTDSLSGNILTNITGRRYNGTQVTHSIVLVMPTPSLAPGSYLSKVAVTYPVQQIVLNDTEVLNVQITAFAGNVGEYYEGSFSGSFTSSGTGNTHTITNGSFRVRRIQ